MVEGASVGVGMLGVGAIQGGFRSIGQRKQKSRNRLPSVRLMYINNQRMPGIRVKPWNRVDGPIYSLATTAGGKGNFNICSYVTPIAMKPKRFIVGVYKDTKTLANLEANPIGLLNYLAQDQANHIKLLGKKSGHNVDKVAQLGSQVEHVGDGLYKIKGAIATLRLRFLERLDCGDHWAWLANVESYENLREAPALTLEELKRQKLILV
jgi:flavin reductase (DIM6/NTAB) family NADH-FMN oxidoreductase RutF